MPPQSNPHQDGETPDALVTASQLAKRLSVSQGWVYQAASDGRLPHIRLGGADGPVRFVASEIDVWLEEQRRAWMPARRGRALR